MNDTVRRLWPELEWIENAELREKTARVWEYALERSVLTAADLQTIPFTLLAKKTVSFMAHKRSVVHICRESARLMQQFYGDALPIDMDTLISGAILIDVGKLLEYEKDADGKLVQGREGALLRHPFSGAALAHRFDLPTEVIHMIAGHSKEGDLGSRTVEGWIVHHVDFMTFEPFKTLK
jgi:putative nucleotidyltransferase with HDIG domain